MENAAKRRWFVRGDVQMCLAPQRRAIFRGLTFKTWSGPVSFLRFWLESVLLATAARHFSGSRLAKWLRPPALRCFVHFDAQMCFAPQARANFLTSELPRWLRHRQFFSIFTCKCASRRSGAPFFQIATCKMAPALRCFVHFDAQMCFAPQARAIF